MSDKKLEAEASTIAEFLRARAKFLMDKGLLVDSLRLVRNEFDKKIVELLKECPINETNIYDRKISDLTKMYELDEENLIEDIRKLRNKFREANKFIYVHTNENQTPGYDNIMKAFQFLKIIDIPTDIIKAHLIFTFNNKDKPYVAGELNCYTDVHYYEGPNGAKYELSNGVSLEPESRKYFINIKVNVTICVCAYSIR